MQDFTNNQTFMFLGEQIIAYIFYSIIDYLIKQYLQTGNIKNKKTNIHLKLKYCWPYKIGVGVGRVNTCFRLFFNC